MGGGPTAGGLPEVAGPPPMGVPRTTGVPPMNTVAPVPSTQCTLQHNPPQSNRLHGHIRWSGISSEMLTAPLPLATTE